jgi:hypothetical protein
MVKLKKREKKQSHRRRSATSPQLIYVDDPSLSAQRCRWSGFFGHEICICWAGSGEAKAGGERDGSRGERR